MPEFLPKNRFQVCARDSSGKFTKLGSFRNVSGLSVETEQTKWKTGDMLSELTVPGETKFNNITLKKGSDDDHQIANWRAEIFSGDCSQGKAYKDVFILIIDRKCIVRRVIHVSNAWPSKYELEELDSMSSDALLESVELSHSGWVYAKTKDENGGAEDTANGGNLIGEEGKADTAGSWTIDGKVS